MKKNLVLKYLLFIVMLLMGILIGGAAVWIDSYQRKAFQPEIAAGIKNILMNSNKVIDLDASCQHDKKTTVAEIVSDMLAVNIPSKRNLLDFYCVNNTCALSLSDCKPWSQECGQRVLLYDFTLGEETKPFNFRCINVP